MKLTVGLASHLFFLKCLPLVHEVSLSQAMGRSLSSFPRKIRDHTSIISCRASEVLISDPVSFSRVYISSRIAGTLVVHVTLVFWCSSVVLHSGKKKKKSYDNPLSSYLYVCEISKCIVMFSFQGQSRCVSHFPNARTHTGLCVFLFKMIRVIHYISLFYPQFENFESNCHPKKNIQILLFCWT